MRRPLDLLDDEVRDGLPRESAAIPGAMLATLTVDHFADPDWIYERKPDGQRVLAGRTDGHVHLRSRNDLALDATYPELVDALSGEGPDLVVDGEVVAFEGNITSFARLQARMQVRDADRARATGVAVSWYLFDLLHLEGRSTRVGEFGFTEWTRGGRLRHPRFLGLRNDEDAAHVVRERPR